MRNTKDIDPSLKKKINQNDEKLRLLYDKEYQLEEQNRSKTNKSLRNKQNRRAQSQTKKKNHDDSFSEIILKTYNDNEPSRETEEINSKMSKTIEVDKKRPAGLANRIEKRMKFKNREATKSNTVYNNKMKKKVYNKEQVDEMVTRLYQNNYKHRKPAYKEEEKNKTIDAENEPDIGVFIERLEEDLKKRNENLENIKKELEKDEKEKCTYKPKMCKGSKKYNESKKDNFFERQKNFNEKKNQKEEKLKEIIKKKQEDEIKENNILLKKNGKKKHRKGKSDVNETSEKQNNKKEEVEKTIKKFFEWEEQRKKKIEDKKKEKTEKIDKENDYIPKINVKSQHLAEKNQLKIKEPNVFERLAAHDQILKEKKKILIDMYTPSFQPRSYVPRNMNLDKFKKKNYLASKENQPEEEEEEEEDEDNEKRKKKKHKKRNEDSDEENEDEENEEEEEDENNEDNDKEEEKGDDFDFQQDTMKFADDQVQDALRNSLFKRKK